MPPLVTRSAIRSAPQETAPFPAAGSSLAPVDADAPQRILTRDAVPGSDSRDVRRCAAGIPCSSRPPVSYSPMYAR